MAARTEPAVHTRQPRLVDLQRLGPADLDQLLEEEIGEWRRAVNWDFRPSAALVTRFVGMQALGGYALAEGGRTIGYSYFIAEEHKGLIGDLFVTAEFRSVENENVLLDAVLDALMGTPGIRRIECQLMMSGADPDRRFPGSRYLSVFDRNFMMLDLAGSSPLPGGRSRRAVWFENWSDRHHEGAAQLIAAAYTGHIDSRINDQYRSVSGARRFLHNIVQYPGCGSFFAPGSLAAFDASTGRMAGIALASLVGPDVGHITQLCAANEVRGEGVGFELMRRSIEALRGHGCRGVGLTVTSANREALRLYERAGFAAIRRFNACVWQGFRG